MRSSELLSERWALGRVWLAVLIIRIFAVNHTQKKRMDDGGGGGREKGSEKKTVWRQKKFNPLESDDNVDVERTVLSLVASRNA